MPYTKETLEVALRHLHPCCGASYLDVQEVSATVDALALFAEYGFPTVDHALAARAERDTARVALEEAQRNVALVRDGAYGALPLAAMAKLNEISIRLGEIK